MTKAKKAQAKVFDEAPVVDLPVECLLGTSEKKDREEFLVKKGPRAYEAQQAVVVLPEEVQDVAVEAEAPVKQATKAEAGEQPERADTIDPPRAKVPIPAAIHSTPSHTSFHMTHDYMDHYDQRPVCGEWRKFGYCRREMCRYAHVDTAKPPPPRMPARHRGARDVPCRFYAQGSCTKGHQCPFSHSSYGAPPSDVTSHSHSPYDSSHMGWDSHYSSMHMGMGMGGMSGHSGMGMSSMGMGMGMNPAMAYQGYNGYGGYAPSQPAAAATEEAIPPHPDTWQAQAGSTSWTSRSGYKGQDDKTHVYKDEGSEKVSRVRSNLGALKTTVLTSVILAAFEWNEEDRGVLLGLATNSIGITRFKSVLIKRSIRHCKEAGHAHAIANLIDWEKALLPWLPKVEGDFAKYFESHLCLRVIEILRCMVAAPSSRFRLPDDVCIDSAKSDPAAMLLNYWMPHSLRLISDDMRKEWPEAELSCLEAPPADPHAVFKHTSEMCWMPTTHYQWPITFRGRTKTFLKAAMRNQYMKLDLPLLGDVLAFLPPLCAQDVPKEPENTAFLDIVCAVLAHYSLNALGATDSESQAVVKERLGEFVWPLILGVFGENCAPKITGMFLQMDPEDLLLDIVNGHRFIESLQEAWKVWENSSQGRPEEED